MAVDVGKADRRFIQRALDDPAWAREEQRRLLDHNRDDGAVYGDEPLPVTLNPQLITPRQRRLLESASHHLSGALDRLVDAFLDDASRPWAWEMDEQTRRLAAVDPGFDQAVPVARFDGFLDAEGLSFLEFNTDSPAGPGYGDVIQAGFEAMVDRNPELGEGLQLPGERRLDHLADTLLDCYHDWRRAHAEDRPANPRVVVTDWRDVSSRPDMELTVQRLQDRGLEAAFADPRDLELDGDQLVHDGRPVDLVYKRVIVDELVQEAEARALAEAYEAGTICLVNPPRSVIAGDKRAMAALQDDELQAELTVPQREAIDRFVPWTRVLEPGSTILDGYQVNLRDLVLDNKDKFVLKAAVSYGGRDIALGPTTDQETWGQLVDEHLKDGDWIVQRVVDVPEALFARADEDGVHLDALNVNVNPFVFGGRYAGAYTRVSADDVINVAAGGGLAATVTLDPGGQPS
jgi:uncharacterized circularly permuted ATP-grasp superfamily protein